MKDQPVVVNKYQLAQLLALQVTVWPEAERTPRSKKIVRLFGDMWNMSLELVWTGVASKFFDGAPEETRLLFYQKDQSNLERFEERFKAIVSNLGFSPFDVEQIVREFKGACATIARESDEWNMSNKK
jgi:hypothetical protein